ncbi:MAG: hypothetical protein VYE68_12135 [Acidobacteriota bacterium]|nr:hypothetical protein [Acidobacteriota bacterium]
MRVLGLRVGLSVLTLVTIGLGGVAAQTEPTPRTPWGAPDLQGVWDFRSLTPMQRPEELSDNEIFSAEEAVSFAAESIRQRSRDNDTSDRVVPYNDFWFDEGTVVTTERTSLITDPPDGRVPPLAEEGTARRDALALVREGVSAHEPTPGGFVEDLGPGGLQVRCILGFNSGPPMAPSAYNNNVQLFQTEDAVVLLAEMNHNVRVVPLDGSEHLDATVRQWTGDARGRWDGDTLVVETTNFLRETNFMQASTTRHLTLIERFTRVGDDTLRYDVTIDDPTVWTRPWTFSVPMNKNPEPMYEYACHEGNYGLYNILAGAASESTEGTR